MSVLVAEAAKSAVGYPPVFFLILTYTRSVTDVKVLCRHDPNECFGGGGGKEAPSMFNARRYSFLFFT